MPGKSDVKYMIGLKIKKTLSAPVAKKSLESMPAFHSGLKKGILGKFSFKSISL